MARIVCQFSQSFLFVFCGDIMVFTLVYVSDANLCAFGNSAAQQIETIEQRSTFNNDLYDVRGFLFYYDKKFLQILQGEFDSIISVFGKIKEDPRHSNIRIIWFSNAQKHSFEKWSMAYSMSYAAENYKTMVEKSGLMSRFVPENGHLTPSSFQLLMHFATQSEDELNVNQDKLYG